MKSELTDVYAVIRREFKDAVNYFGMQENAELESFLHYNARNQMFMGTDDNFYHNANFKNLETGKLSRIFSDGQIYFFPQGNDMIAPENNMTAFRLGKDTKSIKVNEAGLFVEKSIRGRQVITQYYDRVALAEISKRGLTAGNIDYIEDYIQGLGLQPDRIITVSRSGENFTFSISENGEIITQEQIPADDSRTLYSVYYEFMRKNNYYGRGKDNQQPVSDGIQR